MSKITIINIRRINIQHETQHYVPMIGENRQLITDDPVEFEI